MDQIKTGELIRQLRISSGLTQKQLAESINVGDKAVSKWERGCGCPDVSLLPELAKVFGIDVNVLLSGEIDKNEKEKGNMKKLKFYVCRDCGNIMTAASEASITCCGSRLSPLEPHKAEESEKLNAESIDGGWYITSDHEMTKAHYISFAAYQSDSCVMIFKQYPEWDLQINLPPYRCGRLVWYCTKHGLMYRELVNR